MKFIEYFNSKIITGSKKFTIVLGCGFHTHVIGDDTILTNLYKLLESVDSTYSHRGNYLLDFEKIITSQSINSMASIVEKDLLVKISTHIKKKQISILENHIDKYPSFIFNPSYVSQIISLNFDEVAEWICKIKHQAIFANTGFIPINNNKGSKSYLYQTTKYKVLKFPNNKTITFWHPHGSISKPTGLILSARKYGQHLSAIERLRKHSKQNERIKNALYTWYDALINNPVIIIGASISDYEWDLWSAFANRERNFSQPKNNLFYSPVFQMRETGSSLNCLSSNKLWFYPLFEEVMTYKEQWKSLEDIFQKQAVQ